MLNNEELKKLLLKLKSGDTSNQEKLLLMKELNDALQELTIGLSLLAKEKDLEKLRNNI